MEDLVKALSGSVHVSQDQYDLKALQEYLAATIALPNLPLSPANAFRPLPPSRSASTTRQHLHTALHPDPPPIMSASASFPSPALASSTNGAFWNSAEDVSMTTQTARPGALRRTSSYGFGGSKEYVQSATVPGDAYSAFENDAFAPLHEQPSAGDRWREAPNPWAGFVGTSKAFGNNLPAHAQPSGDQRKDHEQADGTDDEAMDEEWADQSMDVVDDEDSVEEAMGFDVAESSTGYGDWDRGRRRG